MADWKQKYEALVSPSGLNEYQHASVDELVRAAKTPAPLRLVAAAGSGKSRTIIAATSKAVNEGILQPEDIIVTTFTRKAADELQEKIKAHVNPKLWHRLSKRINTFHGLALRWLMSKGTKNQQVIAEYPNGFKRDKNLDGKVRTRRREVGEEGETKTETVGLPINASRLWSRIIGQPWFNYKKGGGKTPREIPGLEGTGFYGLDVSGSDEEKAAGLVPTGGDYALAIGLIRSRAKARTDEHAQQALWAMQRFAGDVVLDSRVLVQVSHEEQRKARDWLADNKYNIESPLPFIDQAWKWYDRAKDKLKAWDFADALHVYWKHGTESAKLIIVDEAQDNSWMQLDIARQIAERGGGKFAIVGDVRQSIYSWRGAMPSYMENADRTHGAKTLEIPTNYRSGRQIVELGNTISGGKSWAVGSQAIPARRNDFPAPADWYRLNAVQEGESQAEIAQPTALSFVDAVDDQKHKLPRGYVGVLNAVDGDPSDGAEEIAAAVKKALDAGADPKDIAVLVRTNSLGEFIEFGLLKAGIPAVRLGMDYNFFDRASVAAGLAYMLISSPTYNSNPALAERRARNKPAHLERIVNTPKRYLSPKRVTKAVAAHMKRNPGSSIVDGIDAIIRGGGRYNGNYVASKYRGVENLRDLRATLIDLSSKSWEELPLAVYDVLNPETDEEDEEDEREDSERALSRNLAAIAEGFDDLNTFLQFVGRVQQTRVSFRDSDMDNAKKAAEAQKAMSERVTISTVHRSKGLQWPTIFIPCTDGIFPLDRALDRDPEEELRLFYVAVTRAQDNCILTYSDYRLGRKPGQVSVDKVASTGPGRYIYRIFTPFYREQRALDEALLRAKQAPWKLVDDDTEEALFNRTFTWRNPVAPEWFVRVVERPAPNDPQTSDEGVAGAVWTVSSKFGGQGWQVVTAPEGFQGDETVLDDSERAHWRMPAEAVEVAITYMESNAGKSHVGIDDAAEIRFADFVSWVAQMEGEVREGLTYADFATWLTEDAYKQGIIDDFRRIMETADNPIRAALGWSRLTDLWASASGQAELHPSSTGEGYAITERPGARPLGVLWRSGGELQYQGDIHLREPQNLHYSVAEVGDGEVTTLWQDGSGGSYPMSGPRYVEGSAALQDALTAAAQRAIAQGAEAAEVETPATVEAPAAPARVAASLPAIGYEVQAPPGTTEQQWAQLVHGWQDTELGKEWKLDSSGWTATWTHPPTGMVIRVAHIDFMGNPMLQVAHNQAHLQPNRVQYGSPDAALKQVQAWQAVVEEMGDGAPGAEATPPKLPAAPTASARPETAGTTDGLIDQVRCAILEVLAVSTVKMGREGDTAGPLEGNVREEMSKRGVSHLDAAMVHFPEVLSSLITAGKVRADYQPDKQLYGLTMAGAEDACLLRAKATGQVDAAVLSAVPSANAPARPIVWVRLPEVPTHVRRTLPGKLIVSRPLAGDRSAPATVSIPRPHDSTDKRSALVRVGSFVMTQDPPSKGGGFLQSIYRVEQPIKPGGPGELALVASKNFDPYKPDVEGRLALWRLVREEVDAGWGGDDLSRLLIEQDITEPEDVEAARAIFEAGGSGVYQVGGERGPELWMQASGAGVYAPGADRWRDGTVRKRKLRGVTPPQVVSLAEQGALEAASLEGVEEDTYVVAFSEEPEPSPAPGSSEGLPVTGVP